MRWYGRDGKMSSGDIKEYLLCLKRDLGQLYRGDSI